MTPPVVASHADHTAEIEAEKIRTHYRSMPAAFIGIAFVATITAAAIPMPANPLWLYGWLGGVYALSIARFAVWRAYHKANPPPEQARRWGRYAVIVYALSGFIWGFGNIILYPPGHVEYQLLLLFVALGAAMGALVGQVSYMPTFYWFMYPLILLSVGSFLRDPDGIHIAFSLLMLVYLAVGTRLALNLHRSYLESLYLRFQNVDLIENLQKQKAAAVSALQSAEESSRAKSRFLAAASHDLRQPLHALSLFVQSLEEAELPRSERKTLENVRRATDAMEELFNALLDVSKLDAGIVEVNRAVVPVRPILERVVGEYKPVAEAKGLRLRSRCRDVYVRTDAVLLERIVRNLVSNAICYTDAGSVLIGCRKARTGVRIDVWDTGPGIPANQRELIFHEFYQAGNPERDRRKGLGLGLAIVDRLSRLLDHPVSVRSQEGRGSVFRVDLPAGDPADYVADSPEPSSVAKADLAGRWIIVIDDELAVQQGAEAVLRKWKCEVTVAGSLAELQACFADTDRVPDLIISDYRLRGNENGIQVIRAIRQEYNIEIPAVLITGDTGPDRLREAQASGLPLLHKPLGPARLRTLLASLLTDNGRRKDRTASNG